jgi:hypothetical protein
LAGKKCEELKRALNFESENDGDPAEKKPKLEPNNEFYEENGNKNVNDFREKIQIEEVPEEARSTNYEDLEEALKTIKTKEAAVEQLKELVTEKDAEINKAEGVTERFRSTSKQLAKVQSLFESSKNRLINLEAENEELKKEKDAVLVKCDLDDALKTAKIKEAENEQLMKAASVKDADIMKQKCTSIQLKKKVYGGSHCYLKFQNISDINKHIQDVHETPTKILY